LNTELIFENWRHYVNEEVNNILLEQDMNNYLLENMTEKQYNLYEQTGEIPEELLEGFLGRLKDKIGKLAIGAVFAAGLLGGPSAALADHYKDPATNITYNFIKGEDGTALKVECGKGQCVMHGEISAEEYSQVKSDWEPVQKDVQETQKLV